MPDEPATYGTGAPGYNEVTDKLKIEGDVGVSNESAAYDAPSDTLRVSEQKPLALLHTTGTLLAGTTAEASAWFDVRTYDVLRIMRTSTGGVYVFEIDWSRTGVAEDIDLTEVVTVANNTSVEKPIGALFARFRVRNTDALAFTAHRTSVHAR